MNLFSIYYIFLWKERESFSAVAAKATWRSMANPVNWWLGDSIKDGRDSLRASLCAPAGRYKFNERHWRVYCFISLYKCFEQAQALAQKNETIKTHILIVHSTCAEREGFEPTVRKAYNGFRDRPDRPLRHLSSLALDYFSKAGAKLGQIFHLTKYFWGFLLQHTFYSSQNLVIIDFLTRQSS